MSLLDEPKILDAVGAFLAADPLPMLIGGEDVRGDERLPVFDPSYGTQLCAVSVAGAREVDAAVAAAQAALADPAWRDCSPARRAELLWTLSTLIERDRDILAQLDALDCGLPVEHAGTHEIGAVVEDLRYYAGWTTKLDGRVISVGIPGYEVTTRREPVGVCAAITSWNFPMEAFSGKVGPALATGNALVLKPAELAPLSALWLARLVGEAGFPPGVLNVVLGGAETGELLVAHPGVAKVAFTGSTAVGRKIAAAAGAGLKRVSVELGGKSPVVICPDADLDAAIASTAGSIFGHSGQNCVAGSRVLAHRDVADAVFDGLVRRAGELVQGPALQPGIDLGPVISAARRDAILAHVAGARTDGAEVLAGGGVPAGTPDGGWYVQPTVLAGLPATARAMREEIFGPVVAVAPYDDLDEALQRANAGDFGLAASIWTGDLATARRFVATVDAGVVWVNGHTLYDSAAPFGGTKQSGFGRELGEESLLEYTRTKTVWLGERSAAR